MIVEELAARLGLDVDAVSFTKGILLADGLKLSLQGVANTVKALARELVSSITDTADYGGQLKDLSERTGINTDALQEMRFAAERAGAPFGSLVMGIKQLQIASVQATQGNKALAGVFGKLGVSVRDSNGNLKSGEALMYDVAAGMAKLGDDATRTRLAQQLFGRGGQTLLPIMKNNEDSLARQAQRFREMGVSMEADGVQNADDFGDAMFDLNTVLRAFKRDVGGPLLKPLAKFLDTLRSWVMRVRAAMKGGFDKFLERVKWGFMGIGSVLLGVVLPGLVAQTAAVYAGSGAYLAMALAAAKAGIAAAWAAVLPVLPWIALAALIVLAAEDLYQFFTGGESLIGEFLSGPWVAFNEAVEGTIAEIAASFEEFWNNVVGWGREKIDWVIAKFQALKAAVLDFVGSLPGGKWAMDAMFGAGASPSASAAASSSTRNQTASSFRASIQVYSPSADPVEVANQTKASFWETYHSEMGAASVAAEAL